MEEMYGAVIALSFNPKINLSHFACLLSHYSQENNERQ
uniref:Uncharacterized protein n=1 Tax=Methylophaga nitratireducenticrescens TaxID=754476 RepID=I1XHB0_METNJ